MSQADLQYNRALQDAISTLLTTSKKSEENLDLAQFLFKDAYLRQEQNKDQLESLGIALPEEYKTGNYGDFVKRSGNKNVMRTLGGMYGQAVRNDELLTDAITTFNRGQLKAQELEKAGAGGTSYYDYTTEEGEPSSYLPEGYGQVPFGEYMLNPEEIKALATKGDIAPGDYVNEVYMAGFNKGTRGQESAMAMLQTDQMIEQTRFNLNAGKLEFASQSNNQTIGLIGTTVTNNMFEDGLAELIGYKGILQIEGGGEKFAEFIEDIIEQGAWPDIQGELIGALQQYAGAGTNADIHKGFVQMTSNAYQFLRVIEERQKLAIENKTILPNEFGMINEHDIKLLRSLDPAYNDAYNRIEQYKSLGIPIGNQKVLQQAFMSSQIESNIIDAYNKMGEGNLSTVSRDLNITQEALYEQVDWMPEETYSNTISGIIAADAYDSSLVPISDEGGLALPEGLAANWEDITGLVQEQDVLKEGLTSSRAAVVGNLQSFAADIPGVRNMLSKIKNVDLSNYIPSDKEMAELKVIIERDIAKFLDPATQKPWSNIPVLGMLAPEQGYEGVIGNAEWVMEQQARWTEFVSAWEKHHLLKGTSKPELATKFKALNIPQ